MAGQLTYNFNPAIGVVGMIASSRESNIVISAVAQGLVPVGILCSGQGTDDQIGMQPNSADPNSSNPGQVIAFPSGVYASPLPDTAFIGIPIYDSSRPPYDPTNAYQNQDPVPVLRKGEIYVRPDVVVLAFTPVFVWATPGIGDPPAGSFTGSANGGKAVLFPRGQYLSASTAAQPLVVLELW
jgi:hypothetical protein